MKSHAHPRGRGDHSKHGNTSGYLKKQVFLNYDSVSRQKCSWPD